jgi:hypothetical protein
MITTCWSNKPEKRRELSAVHQVFLKYGQQETQNIKLGDLNSHHNRHLTIAEMFHIETGQQQHRGFLPRITSLFQFLQESEPEIERSVGEMDKASFYPFPPSSHPETHVNCSVLRITLCQTVNN